jgi:exodeoxyribonuclease V alpha subunit
MTVRAKIKYIVYPKKDIIELDDYIIAKCVTQASNIPPEYRFAAKNDVTFSAKGTGIPTSKKFDVLLDGIWSFDEKYGLTLSVQSADIAPPSDKEGIINYLVMFLDGCGKASAKRIYKKFGQATIMVLQDAPEKLYEVPRLRKSYVEKMIKSFQRTQGIVELTTLLSPFNIGKRRIEYIFNMLGPQSAEIIRKDPYCLQELHGIGYETMERLSQQYNSDPYNPNRIKAAIKHCIKQSAYGSATLFENPVLKSGGNLYINQYELRAAALRLLNQRSDKLVDAKLVTQIIWEMYTNRELLGENGNVYLPDTYCNERDCAKAIVEMITFSKVKRHNGQSAERAVLKAEQMIGIELTKNQRTAVLTVLANPLTVITGGAGTGKSTVLRVVLEALKLLGENPDEVVLAAPTGKAAIRMTECTKYPASTLHKALGLMSEEDYWRSQEDFDSLQANFVVCDEFSMSDMFLAYRLFAQIDLSKTRVLLVGDVGQLPSVGAGDVLNQIIQSGIVPTVKLMTIFRQAQESNIIRNSVNISNGDKYIVFEKDCTLFKSKNQEEILDQLLQVYFRQIQKYGVDETIILCPVKEKGNLCTKVINSRIQALINPPAYNKIEARIHGNTFRIGDKIIQLKNKVFKQTCDSDSSLNDDSNTEISIELCNGDVGKIKSISKDSNGYTFFVEFSDNRSVKLDEEAIKDIALAYSLTIHKSQGSEYASVILPLHYYYPDGMMTRNLLYTAVTRAKKELTVVGDTGVMYKAIDNVIVLQRNTALAEKIKKYYKEAKEYESSAN